MEGVHARLKLMAGRFWLQDMDSTGGTWVNYGLIGTEIVRIYTGDLIHFGSAGFRFTINDDQARHEATVSKYEPNL